MVMVIDMALIQRSFAEEEFTLELDASCAWDTLTLDFILGTTEPASWTTYLILLGPIQVIDLWSVPLPVIDPPYDIPISFPMPSLGWVVILTELVTVEGLQAFDFDLADSSTVCTDGDGDGYAIEGGDCGPVDCDDFEPLASPAASEGPAGDPTCTDTLDNDCDGSADMLDPDCILMRPLPDTGIDLCSDDTQEIPCPAPGEPFYGQDAQYTTIPMSYTDHGDGTVTDNVTGLMWQQEDDDTNKTWFEAIDYCEDLTLAGHEDWRLPDNFEIHALVDYSRYLPTIDTITFPGTETDYYWSSSPHNNPQIAWRLSFRYAGLYTYGKYSLGGYARCVRGERRTPSFTDHGDGTVTDNVTGLMWQQDEDTAGRNWEGALAYCETLDLADHRDWRLPDAKEMFSIVDNERYDPAIDITYFPSMVSSYFFSSSTYAYDPQYVLIIEFGEGRFFDMGKLSHYYVRCVR